MHFDSIRMSNIAWPLIAGIKQIFSNEPYWFPHCLASIHIYDPILLVNTRKLQILAKYATTFYTFTLLYFHKFCFLYYFKLFIFITFVSCQLMNEFLQHNIIHELLKIKKKLFWFWMIWYSMLALNNSDQYYKFQILF